MDKAKEFLDKFTTGELSDSVSRLTFPPHHPPTEPSFYENFAITSEASASPPSARISSPAPSKSRRASSMELDGNLAMAAITTLIDFMGAAVAYRGYGRTVSTDVSISTAKLGDEVEMESRCSGRKGGYSGTHILIRNKTSGEIVADGRHSIYTSFSKLRHFRSR